MFLTVAGWSLLLLPFQLVNTAADGWKTGYVIAMIVVGVVLLALFAVWEKYFAPVQYFPWAYLKDRTILGACLLYGFMFLSILYALPTHHLPDRNQPTNTSVAAGTRTTSHTSRSCTSRASPTQATS